MCDRVASGSYVASFNKSLTHCLQPQRILTHMSVLSPSSINAHKAPSMLISNGPLIPTSHESISVTGQRTSAVRADGIGNVSDVDRVEELVLARLFHKDLKNAALCERSTLDAQSSQ